MKQLYTFIALLIVPAYLSAQVDQISVGPSYANDTYYSLADGMMATNSHTAWDIAFGVDGLQEGGVFVNEAIALSMGPPLPGVEMYFSGATDFATADTSGMYQLFNPELSWSTGAANRIGNPSDPFDYGWGIYNPGINKVLGTHVYFVKLRSGVFKKLSIDSLVLDTYTLRYANLDGSNEHTHTINKNDYQGKTLAYFSLEADSALDLEPLNWDMKFTRYATQLNAGQGDTVNYMVTGVLSNKGVEVAQADGIDPLTVNYADYDSLYTDSLTAIGHDWKNFNFGTSQWSLPADRVYFVKTKSDELWMVQFIDFEGSSTGISTLEKTFQTTLTTIERPRILKAFDIYPNPATHVINVAFDAQKVASEANIRIHNGLGQVVFQHTIRMQMGLNLKRLSLNLAPGMYHVTLQLDEDIVSKPVLVK